MMEAGHNLREGNWGKLATLEPVNSGSVNRNSFLSADVGSILKISMLTLLFSLEV